MASLPRSRRTACKLPRCSSTTRPYRAHCQAPAHFSAWRSIRRPGSTSSTTAATRSTCCITEGASRAAPRDAAARGAPLVVQQFLSDPDLSEYACEIGTEYLLGDRSRVAALQQPIRNDFDPAWHIEPGHID